MTLAFAPAAEAEALTRSGQTLADLALVSPMVLVAVWALLLLLADAFSAPGLRGFQRRIALVGLGIAGATGWLQLVDPALHAGVEVFSGFLVVDPLSLLLDLAVLAVTAATVLFAGDFARSHRFEYGEQESLLLIAAFGVMVLNHANTLLAVFLGIETMSIAVYVMVGARWNSGRSSEAALKYFIMGAFASGLLVMGIALLYGATGTLALPELGERVGALFSAKGGWVGTLQKVIALKRGGAGDATRDQVIVALAPIALLLPGMLLITAALLFKVSAVPFHMWTPDAYDGAPTPTTGFMAAAVKIGGFAALLKFLVATLATSRLVHAPYGWATVVAVLAMLTMTVGNLAAVRQRNVKRMLAYSSVAHVGYLLIGVVAAALFYVDKAGGNFVAVDQATWSRSNGNLAVASLLFYLVTYAIATVGAFACVAFHGAHKQEATGLHQWSGLARRHPGIALSMAICLLSLMGMPPIAGFFGKLGLFRVAMTSGDPMLRWLVIVGVLNSVVGAAYYLRVIIAMYFGSAPQAEVPVLEGRGVRVVIAASAVLSVLAGVGAEPLLDRCRIAAAGVRGRAGGSGRARAVQAVVDELEARGGSEPDTAPAPEPATEGTVSDLPEVEPNAEGSPTPSVVVKNGPPTTPASDAKPEPATPRADPVEGKPEAAADAEPDGEPEANKAEAEPGGTAEAKPRANTASDGKAEPKPEANAPAGSQPPSPGEKPGGAKPGADGDPTAAESDAAQPEESKPSRPRPSPPQP